MEYILNYIFTEPIGFLVLLIIIFFQVRSFYFNWKRMKTFSQIFEKRMSGMFVEIWKQIWSMVSLPKVMMFLITL